MSGDSTVSLGPPGAAPALPPLVRGAAVDRYVILDLLGAGGMGVVYAAYDPELDRKVALKLLRSDRTGDAAQDAARQQLLREAQAVARLSHPNVVAVHDAGTHGTQVFIAMELVEGRNLRQWLQEQEEGRSWREVLAVLLDAGRGLAAAHAAGLVHRDVKPENVLIGEDGRVRMADFGIACRTGGAGDGEGEGFAAGTPAYMAPEQRRGGPVDARSDQYSFCVTLWEALFGRRPPAGESRRVPSWLRQALLRGLSDDPEDRHPSLEALLTVLGRDPAVLRRRWLAAAAVVLAGGISVLAWERGRESRVRLCRAGEARLAGVWDEARKRAIRDAFAATREPQAAAAWADAARTLDGYAARWTAMHRDACEATWLRGEQSEDLLDRRMLCLERRWRDLDALTAVFADADAQVVRHAGQAARNLTDLGECADKDALFRRTPTPGDPAARARISEVETRLSKGWALFWAGQYDPALETASLAVRQADALAFAPLQAQEYLLLGSVREERGEYPQAERALYQAVWAADNGGDDARRAWIWKKLVHIVGYRQGRPDEALRLLRNGRAALARAGRHPSIEASLLNSEANLLTYQQRYREAVPIFRQAIALTEREDPEDPQLYVLYANLGEVLLALGEAGPALAHQRRALQLAHRHLPGDHPRIAALRFNIANSLIELGRLAEAGRLLEEILALREKRLGPDHADVAETLSTLGSVWTDLGQPDRALPLLERALAVFEEKTPSGYPYREVARCHLAEALIRLGRLREAETHLHRALAALEISQGTASPLLALPLISLGGLERERGRPAAAAAHLERAIRLLDQASAYPSQRMEACVLLARIRPPGARAGVDSLPCPMSPPPTP